MKTSKAPTAWPWNAIAWMAMAMIYALTIMIAWAMMNDRDQEIIQLKSKANAAHQTQSAMIEKLRKETADLKRGLRLERDTRNQMVQDKFDVLAHDIKVTAGLLDDQLEMERTLKLLKAKQDIEKAMGRAKSDH